MFVQTGSAGKCFGVDGSTNFASCFSFRSERAEIRHAAAQHWDWEGLTDGVSSDTLIPRGWCRVRLWTTFAERGIRRAPEVASPGRLHRDVSHEINAPRGGKTSTEVQGVVYAPSRKHRYVGSSRQPERVRYSDVRVDRQYKTGRHREGSRWTRKALTSEWVYPSPIARRVSAGYTIRRAPYSAAASARLSKTIFLNWNGEIPVRATMILYRTTHVVSQLARETKIISSLTFDENYWSFDRTVLTKANLFRDRWTILCFVLTGPGFNQTDLLASMCKDNLSYYLMAILFFFYFAIPTYVIYFYTLCPIYNPQ